MGAVCSLLFNSGLQEPRPPRDTGFGVFNCKFYNHTHPMAVMGNREYRIIERTEEAFALSIVENCTDSISTSSNLNLEFPRPPSKIYPSGDGAAVMLLYEDQCVDVCFVQTKKIKRIECKPLECIPGPTGHHFLVRTKESVYCVDQNEMVDTKLPATSKKIILAKWGKNGTSVFMTEKPRTPDIPSVVMAVYNSATNICTEAQVSLSKLYDFSSNGSTVCFLGLSMNQELAVVMCDGDKVVVSEIPGNYFSGAPCIVCLNSDVCGLVRSTGEGVEMLVYIPLTHSFVTRFEIMAGEGFDSDSLLVRGNKLQFKKTWGELTIATLATKRVEFYDGMLTVLFENGMFNRQNVNMFMTEKTKININSTGKATITGMEESDGKEAEFVLSKSRDTDGYGKILGLIRALFPPPKTEKK